MRKALKLGFEFENVTSPLKSDIDETTPTLIEHKQDKTEWEILPFLTSDGNNQPLLPVVNDNSQDHWLPTAKLHENLKRTQLETIYSGVTAPPMPVAETELGEEGHQGIFIEISLDLRTHFTARLPLMAARAVANENTNLKTTTNLMPRTNFRTILNIRVGLMSKSLAISLNWDLTKTVIRVIGLKVFSSLFRCWNTLPLTGVTSRPSVVSAPQKFRPRPPIPPVPVIQAAQEGPTKTRFCKVIETKLHWLIF